MNVTIQEFSRMAGMSVDDIARNDLLTDLAHSKSPLLWKRDFVEKWVAAGKPPINRGTQGLSYR